MSYQMVALLHQRVVLKVSEEQAEEKNLTVNPRSLLSLSAKKSGNIRPEAYAEEIVSMRDRAGVSSGRFTPHGLGGPSCQNRSAGVTAVFMTDKV